MMMDCTVVYVSSVCTYYTIYIQMGFIKCVYVEGNVGRP
jgi:hypothetical protein